MNRVWKVILLSAFTSLFVVGSVPAHSESSSDAKTVTVYKTPTCGCCKKWVGLLEKSGFQVTVHDLSDLTEIKTKYGVPRAFASCHTAIVDGYVVEGHVPIDVIQKMLQEKPKVAGITVPGMPMGSPGMEGEYSEPYDVLTFDNQGNTKVYTSH